MLELQSADLASFAELHGLELVVLFGSQARDNAKPGSDVDLAVLGTIGKPMERLSVEGKLAGCLGRSDLDIVWLTHASWLLAWEVAQGRALFEARPFAFKDFQSLAWLRWADSQVWVQRDRGYFQRSLRGDWQMNVRLVQRKLTAMQHYLRDLEPCISAPLEQFLSIPQLHYTAERLTQLLVDGAASINTEVAQVVAAIPPSDYYSSFFSLARTGWIDSEIAGALAPIAQLRNRLVHDYEVVELSDLYEALGASLLYWRRYTALVFENLERIRDHPT